MGFECKLCMFKILIIMGFKEIEVGFLVVLEMDFVFVWKIIEDDLIFDDVII